MLCSSTGGDAAHLETLRKRISSSVSDFLSSSNGKAESTMPLNGSKGLVTGALPMKEEVLSAARYERSGSSLNGMKDAFFYSSMEKEVPTERWKGFLWNGCVYLVTMGMLISLLMGMNMSWSAIAAALALIVLDFQDARPCLEKVKHFNCL